MKSIIPSVAGFTIFISLLAHTQAASNTTGGPSCGVSKADDSYFSVVGVQGTGVHPRQELRELEKDTETWNIFLQAFARFQAMDQGEKVSYYKIAGIHGVPFGQWDGVTGVEGQEMMGYCPHASNMFGSWHRPYLALFEQILHDRAIEIAKEYPTGEAQDKAMDAADRVRLPYWDWAMNPPNSDEGCMPASLRRPTATVAFPNGTTGNIANPLYRYDFHPLNYDDFAPLSEFQFKNWNHTMRFPLDSFALNATSRNDAANDRIGRQQPNNRDMLYKLLTMYQPFNQVSNKANGGIIGNFETLHDGLHNAFGLGHMGIVEVSAFDPVFWFHHANMDRLIALYQYRYPDTWIEDAAQVKGTFKVTKGAIEGPASPLAPFHMNALGDMWTSTTSRNWTSFGYTYPELMTNPSNQTLTSTLNRLYKPATQGLNNTISTPGDSAGNNSTATTTTKAIDWLCEVKMPTDIQISYSVRAFLGEPDADPKNWPTDPNYVGQLASMSSPRMNSDVIVTGNIVLTERLAQKHQAGELKSLSKEDVAAYLKANFSWRIQALDYSEIPRNNPPAGLNVAVFNVAVSIPESDDEVPTWDGELEYNPDIKGNPPVYNGLGPGGTNSTTPADDVAGHFDSSSGQWVWNNATENAAGQAGGQGGTKVMHETEVVTQYITVGADVTPTPEVKPSTTTAPALTEEASFTPVNVGTRTKFMTSVIIEYATVLPGKS
ncbi:common central domain of tyrosinase-domain-containing protein [Boeremia exigua]|uniref:common central domain of tyrosinase-domain-containing protein n=1 Tax=Boeremia exigua TaxID=749465 RepID=UPI001E8D9A73|nr:common central domain of tyrosinase-domain-containing protein [Boeremia exigua]KAH6633327.1 common central domain of tyrosinase-domain-containing protein [Boeremia exigua]